MKEILWGGSQRRAGKTAAQERAIAEAIKRNPNLVVARVSVNGVKVERPTEGSHEFVEPAQLPAPIEPSTEGR